MNERRPPATGRPVSSFIIRNSALLKEVLRDPFCRYEVRRYWTWRRYLAVSLVLLGFVLLVGGYLCWGLLGGKVAGIHGSDLAGALLTIGHSVSGCCRLPLCILAALAGVLLLVPERNSGLTEQFVLTTVDPWRFAQARCAGRLRGLLAIWLVVGAILVGCQLSGVVVSVAAPAPAASTSPSVHVIQLSVASQVLSRLASLLQHLDLGLMLLLDATVGLCFSARSRTVSGAVIKTFLVSFLLLPAIMWTPYLLFAVAATAGRPLNPDVMIAGRFALWVFHGALGALALKLFTKWARRAAANVFYNPEA